MEQRSLPAASLPCPVIHQAPVGPLANIRMSRSDSMEAEDLKHQLVTAKLNNVFTLLEESRNKRFTLCLASDLVNVTDY